MKKKFTFLIAALMLLTMISQPTRGLGQVAPVNTVLWAENFSGYNNNSDPSGSITNSHTGTTVYGGITLTYSKTNGGTTTQTFSTGGPNDNSNLLISKNGGSFTVSGISTGGATELTVAYKTSGKGTISISCSPNTVSISGSSSGSTITTNGASTIAITFSNSSSSDNLRFDDAQIIVKTAGAATTHTFNYDSNNELYGSVSAKDKDNNNVSDGASIAENAQITLTATPESGYALLSWSKEGTGATLTKNHTSPTVFQMGTGDASVTATFAAAHNFAFSASNGSVAVKNGDNTNVTTNTPVAETATLTVTATPSSGYKFKQWTVTGAGSGVASATTNPTTFTMGTADAELTAVFEPTYHVFYNANTEGATGSTTDANEYVNGQTANVQACGFTKSGFTFQNWNTQSDGLGTTYYPKDSGSTPDQITIGTANVNLFAIWSIEKETVTIGSVSGATISAVYSGGSITSGSSYDCGTVIQLRADGLTSGKAIVWDVYKTEDATTKVTVTNNSFTLPAYAVTISGTVGDLFVKYTAETVVEGDYIIYDSKAMNQTLNDGRLSLTDISALLFDNTILSSDASAYTWHIAPNSGYMTISYTANNNTNYVYTTSKTAAKCIGLKTSVDDAALWTFTRSTNTYLIKNKTNALTNYANLVNGGSYYACYSNSTKESSLYKKSTSYQVDVPAADHGVVTASTSGQSPIAEGENANIRSGAVVTLSATPEDGYIANAWTVYKTGDESTTVIVTSNQFTMPDYPVTVTTSFRSVAPATLTYSANGEITVVDDLTEGDIVTLKTAGEITVPSGYTFEGWSESASDFNDIKTGSYTVMSSISLYAVFSVNKPVIFNFSINKDDFNTTSYAANNNEKTTTATAITGQTMDVKWTSNQVY